MSSMLPAHMEQPPPPQHMSMRTPDVTSPNGTTVAGYGLTHSPQTAPGGMTPLAGISFSPAYNYNMVTTPSSSGQPVINDGSGGYDAMFGMPTNAFGSPAGWSGHPMGHTTPGAAAPSPSTKSNAGSTGTAGDEKDPFMTLLEQLANDEHRQQNGLKNDLDFYLSTTSGHS
ncbi:hypothetical protein PT974_11537 [Cladobotryum mycophilum]|uniref:Uncharacterized protein n=1 Tax=Cladobotryum mycophilum TaxID=491253 RepID=A0ABR0S6H4_9HYPO